MAYQNVQNKDRVTSPATTGQQSAHRRTKSRRARLSTSREHHLDTSAQHTARMYSGDRTIVKNHAPSSTHPNQSYNDST